MSILCSFCAVDRRARDPPKFMLLPADAAAAARASGKVENSNFLRVDRGATWTTAVSHPWTGWLKCCGINIVQGDNNLPGLTFGIVTTFI